MKKGNKQFIKEKLEDFMISIFGFEGYKKDCNCFVCSIINDYVNLKKYFWKFFEV